MLQVYYVNLSIWIQLLVISFVVSGQTMRPSTMRPSMTSLLNKCFLETVTPQQQRDMFQCFTQCLYNLCCRAVNVKDECEQSYVQTEEMDFVKEVNLACQSDNHNVVA